MLNEQGETSRKEICTLKEDSFRLEEENKKLRVALLEFENTRKSQQDFLDNISDFGARVYH